MTESYAYSARNLGRPEDIEDLGAMPEFMLRATPTPTARPAAAPAPKQGAATAEPSANPVRGLARRKTVPTPEPAAGGSEARSLEGDPPAVETAVRTRRKEIRDLHRPSSVNLPVDLVNVLNLHRASTGMSAGDSIVEAIKQTMHWLPTKFGAAAAPSGSESSGFSPRPTSKAEPSPEITKLLAFRLTEKDFDYLDELVTTFGARDRTQLIREALTQFLKD